MGTLENRAHESWLAARQSERRCEEALAEAASLRRKLTTMASGGGGVGGDPGVMEAIAANGTSVLGAELKTAPSPLPLPGSPLLNMPNPLPFLAAPFSPFMGLPPPFLPPTGAEGHVLRPWDACALRRPRVAAIGIESVTQTTATTMTTTTMRRTTGAWTVVDGTAAAGVAGIAAPTATRRAHIARYHRRTVGTTTMTRRLTSVRPQVRRPFRRDAARHRDPTARYEEQGVPVQPSPTKYIRLKTSSNIFINQRLSNGGIGAGRDDLSNRFPKQGSQESS